MEFSSVHIAISVIFLAIASDSCNSFKSFDFANIRCKSSRLCGILLHKTKPLFSPLNMSVAAVLVNVVLFSYCSFTFVAALFASQSLICVLKKVAVLPFIHSISDYSLWHALQEMQAEMEKHMAHLQQLKDFDETLALEREEKARQEQERRRMEVKTKLSKSVSFIHNRRLNPFSVC